jgi:hypothetical protein
MQVWRLIGVLLFVWLATQLPFGVVEAVNVNEYSNTLSDSGPSDFANHTYAFTPLVSLGSGAMIEITLPSDFTFVATSTTFAERNVELYVNGVARTSGPALAAGVDRVEIDRTGTQQLRYTFAPDAVIAANSEYELRVGNNTSGALDALTTFSTSTGTTTIPADVEPIRNSSTLGLHKIQMDIYDGGLVADTEFLIFLNEKVTVTGDTTEEIPPFRFNGAPTSTVGGTTLNVEISLETDELAICKFDTASGTPYAAQPNTFSNTGFVTHSTIVPVTPNSVVSYYVRCLDDEGNFNIDDYLIEFSVSEQPTGTSNTEGDVSGDGTGDGNDGTGTGGGAGGSTGVGGGEENTEGTTQGSGGSGGGGGGGSGNSSGSSGGGGFESSDGPFESGDGRITVSGTAYPGARVTILADGQIVDTVNANSSGDYSVIIDEIARGAYTFGVYAEDDDGTKSSTFSTSFTVSGARASRLSNINITPTIAINPNPADPGQTIRLSGFALPNATVSLETQRDNGSAARTLEAISGSDGAWTTTLDTTGFSRGTYQVRARAEQLDGEKTNFSNYVFYGIGQEAEQPLAPDLNRDGSVNLIDFSIMLFWWQTNGGDSDPPADINQDGTVSLTDFSILLFNWTG